MVIPIEFKLSNARELMAAIGDHILTYGCMTVVDLFDLVKLYDESMYTHWLTYKENMIGWDLTDILKIKGVPLATGYFAIVLPEPHSMMERDYRI